jgi:micrococcal nuclease
MRTILVILLCFSFCCLHAQLTGKVVGVYDGDSFTLLTQENKSFKIRLHGIDAPEHKQDFSKRSHEFLKALISGKAVQVEKRNIDRYGRTIAVVFVNNINVNEEMLKAGMAWHYKEYDKTTRWSALEQNARNSRVGLWSQPSPIAPWDYRKQKRMKSKAGKIKVG